MTARVLPREEYGRLVGTECEGIAPILPTGGQILAVEDGDELVACWAVYPLTHVEGIWIAPHRERAAVPLLRLMYRVARDMGAQAVNTASRSEHVTDMLQRLGAVQLEGEHFSLRVGL